MAAVTAAGAAIPAVPEVVPAVVPAAVQAAVTLADKAVVLAAGEVVVTETPQIKTQPQPIHTLIKLQTQAITAGDPRIKA